MSRSVAFKENAKKSRHRYKELFYAIVLFAISVELSASSAASAQQHTKYSLTFHGECKYTLIYNSPLLPCQDDVLYIIDSGMAAITFHTASAIFVLNGRGDRQPAPSDLFQKINAVMFVQANEIKFRETDFEGECHLSLAADASRFFSLDCDVYNRERRQYVGLRLTKIRSFSKSP